MKSLILPLCMLIASIGSAQKVIRVEKTTKYSTHVFGDDFEGVIFDKAYSSSWLNSEFSKGVVYAPDEQPIDTIDLGKSERFTPSTDDILLAENILQTNLKQINRKLPSSHWRGPEVYKHLPKYIRQYFGYMNNKTEKVIYIYSFWDDNERNKDTYWLENYYHIFDGGSYYWQVKINLTTKKLFNFGVNGAI